MTDSNGLIPTPNAERTVIIFAANSGLKGTLRDEIKTFGVSSPEIADSPDACIKALGSDLAAWLLMDNACGIEKVGAILNAARKGPMFPARPIYLVAPEVAPPLGSVALEYAVTKIRTGQLRASEIKDDLQQLGEFAALEAQLAHVMNEAHKLSQDGQWGAVLELLKEEQGIASAHVGLKIAEVDALINSDDLDGAVKAASAICAADPVNLRGVYTLARVYMKKGKFSEAAAILQKAEQEHALSPARLCALGDCYIAGGKYKQAKEKYVAAIGIDPDSKDAKTGLTKSSLLLGEMDAGLKLAREIGTSVDLARVLNTTAVVASRSKNFDLAHQIYAQGIILLNAEPALAARLWFNQGIAFYRSGNQSQSASCFETASKLDPSFKVAGQNLSAVRRLKDQPAGSPAVGEQPPSMSLSEFDELTASDFREEGMPDL